MAVIGTSGSGKTTLARRLAERLDAPHLELDAVHHQPGWTPLPAEDFRRVVTEFCAAERWVTCGKYGVVRDILLDRADTIVCLDHGRTRQTARVYRRSWGRVLRREELWNGNREPLAALWPFGREAEEVCVARWTWRNVPRARRLFDRVEADRGPDQSVVRLRGWRQIDAFLAGVSSPPAAGALDEN